WNGVNASVRRTKHRTRTSSCLINNPYEPLLTNSDRHPDRPVSPSVTRHIARNVVSWLAFLVLFCVNDYYYYVHAPMREPSWMDSLFLPAFYIAMIFANRGLYRGIQDS